MVGDCVLRPSALYELYEPVGSAAVPGACGASSVRLRAVADPTLTRTVDHPALTALWIRRRNAVRLADLAATTDGPDPQRPALRLIADGALAVRIEGTFVTGPAAVTALLGPAPDTPARGRVETLSIEGVRHVARLPGLGAGELAGRLYHHGAEPVTPRHRRLLPDAAAIERFLGTADLMRRQAICGAWRRTGETPGWLSWRRGGGPRGRRDYKLYVGLGVEALPEALAGIVVAAAEHGARAFKVGASAHGLLRPDKVVIYLDRFTSLTRLARVLAPPLAGARACPVPFTADAGGDGLLSWAIDPRAGSPDWTMGRSWRVFVSRVLGDALAVARLAGSSDTEPWRFALRRLALEDVDVALWRPRGTFGRRRPQDIAACST